jgi:osmotically-inducible protein OsmY
VTGELSPKDTVRTDGDVEAEVISRLQGDPRIPDSLEIAVSAEDGIVELRGTVETVSQLGAAVEDALEASGVYNVHDRLEVSLLGPDRHHDNEIRGAALQMLMWDAGISSESIDVRVDGGWITLTGKVDFEFERRRRSPT